MDTENTSAQDRIYDDSSFNFDSTLSFENAIRKGAKDYVQHGEKAEKPGFSYQCYLFAKNAIETSTTKYSCPDDMRLVKDIIIDVSEVVWVLSESSEEEKIPFTTEDTDRWLRYLNLTKDIFKTDLMERQGVQIDVEAILSWALCTDNFEIEEYVLKNIGFEKVFEYEPEKYKKYLNDLMNKFDEAEKKTVARNIREIKELPKDEKKTNLKELINGAYAYVQKGYKYSPEGMFNRQSYVTLKSLLKRTPEKLAEITGKDISRRYLYLATLESIIEPILGYRKRKNQPYLEECARVLELVRDSVRNGSFPSRTRLCDSLSTSLEIQSTRWSDKFVLEGLAFGEDGLNFDAREVFGKYKKDYGWFQFHEYLDRLEGKIKRYLAEYIKEHPKDTISIQEKRESGMFKELDWYYKPNSMKVREMFVKK